MKTTFIFLGMLIIFTGINAQHEHHSTATLVNETFSLIKALAGDWTGSFKWIGRDSEGKMDAKYYLTGNGTAVVEDLIVDGKAIMTSVYHLDGSDLRLTHYCAAGNQPRLKAGELKAKEVEFNLVDITNLSSPEAGHVKGLKILFKGPAEVELIFTFLGNGKESHEQIQLRRR